MAIITERMKTWHIFLIAGCVAVIALGYLLFPFGGTRSIRYSELYFENQDGIPEKMYSGQEMNLPFTIVNHEGMEIRYHYRIYYEPDPYYNISYLREVADGVTQDVSPEAAVTVANPFTMPNTTKRIKLTVELPEKQQTLFIWIEPLS
jgi:hypothetical protein